MGAQPAVGTHCALSVLHEQSDSARLPSPHPRRGCHTLLGRLLWTERALRTSAQFGGHRHDRGQPGPTGVPAQPRADERAAAGVSKQRRRHPPPHHGRWLRGFRNACAGRLERRPDDHRRELSLHASSKHGGQHQRLRPSRAAAGQRTGLLAQSSGGRRQARVPSDECWSPLGDPTRPLVNAF